MLTQLQLMRCGPAFRLLLLPHPIKCSHELQQVCLAPVANTLLKGAQLLHNISNDWKVFFGKDIIGQQNMLCTG